MTKPILFVTLAKMNEKLDKIAIEINELKKFIKKSKPEIGLGG